MAEVDLPLPQEPEKRAFFSRPSLSREQIWTLIAFGSVVLLGALLRFIDLGAKPLHWDESLHAYFSMQLLHNNIENWSWCAKNGAGCYRYDPLLHGPFQFHAIAFVYLISQWLGAPDHGINTTTVRIAAATCGTIIVFLPYYLRHYLGKVGAWLACFLIAVSPSLVYYSRFAREDIYMACFTLLFIVSVVQYIRTRKVSWIILAALGFVLSYATKEATFLSIAVFGSFAGALVVWELATQLAGRMQFAAPTIVPGTETTPVDVESVLAGSTAPDTTGTTPETVSPPTSVTLPYERFSDDPPVQPRPAPQNRLLVYSFVALALLIYFVIIGIPGILVLNWTKSVSLYTNQSAANLNTAQAVVDRLKSATMMVIPFLGIVLALVVCYLLWRELSDKFLPGSRRGLAAKINPSKQRLLDTILTMPWTHWFFALIIGWFVFMLLFTDLFTYLPGIGDGVWQGIFYWITQQTVARGGQPWYYYFMLIPLYEQIGLIFGIVGIVYSLLHPTRFRLFLIYWFIGNFFIYTWAGEKMPWLVIHITMPMMLLAAIGLRPIVEHLWQRIQAISAHRALRRAQDVQQGSLPASVRPMPKAAFKTATALFGICVAILALILTLQNMYQVTFDHPADAKTEMLVYVQTTPYVNTVMDKIAELDQKYYGGQYTIPIGVTADASWPFSWYLRDYKNVAFNCVPTNCMQYPVIIAAGDALPAMGGGQPAGQYDYTVQFNSHTYEMRAQGNQGYMPPPCQPQPGQVCEPQQYTGVGLGLWLSWGANPPPNASFNLGRAVMRVWQWWWQRIPIGRGVPSRGDQFAPDDTGALMTLFINKKFAVQP